MVYAMSPSDFVTLNGRVAGAFMGGLMACVTGPIVRGHLSNVVEPSMRGRAFAVFVIADDLGKGGGPFIVSRFLLRGGEGGRGEVFRSVVWWGWVACGGIVAITGWTLGVDFKGEGGGGGGGVRGGDGRGGGGRRGGGGWGGGGGGGGAGRTRKRIEIV